ncbi:MAG TPA: MFS transporter, partial [Flavobacterium sp.]|nr:MFS transporter [Flavobacterium sp.]
ILITVITTREYSPQELADFDKSNASFKPETKEAKLSDIFTDFKKMPQTMRQLSWVQFFSWFGLFGMWVFTTPAIAHHIYGLPIEETKSVAYNEASDWVGILFGVYNFVAGIFAFTLPVIAKRIGRKRTHAISLLIGGVSLIGIYFMPNEDWVALCMIGVGIAWASILAMPYAILAGSIPPLKMGVYMGIFNFFIVIPQIINALIGSPIVKYVYSGNAIYAIMMSGASFLIAAALVIRVKDVDDVKVDAGDIQSSQLSDKI